jgi:hypothetical protein
MLEMGKQTDVCNNTILIPELTYAEQQYTVFIFKEEKWYGFYEMDDKTSRTILKHI